MKKTIMLIKIIVFLITAINSYAWNPTGSFYPISRRTILRIAGEITDFSWTPKNTIRNWNSGSVWYTFNPGTIYQGEAYCQQNPQEAWSEFYNYIRITEQGNTYYGNDCSGFVSMSWRLPKRYTTRDFEHDAINSRDFGNSYNPHTDDYVTSLGDINSAENINFLPGDALVSVDKKNKHIILFYEYFYDSTTGEKIGINAIDQMSDPIYFEKFWAWRNKEFYTWKRLSTYRPIRRNKIKEDYVYELKWGTRGGKEGQFRYPSGIAVDNTENVYVVDRYNNRIQKFKSDSTFLTAWGRFGFLGIEYPMDIASINNAIYLKQDIYLKDIFSNMDSIESLLALSESGQIEITDARFFYPEGIAVSPDGNYVYVVDSYNNRIWKFTNDGEDVLRWGSRGDGNGEFSEPDGVAVDKDGNVYVTDTLNNRVQKFTSNGAFLLKWGTRGSGDREFYFPFGIAVDKEGYVYVADTNNNRIQKFTGDGEFVLKWGTLGSLNGQFNYPRGIAVDATDNVYIVDTKNNRVQNFKNDTTFITSWGRFGIGDGEFYWPWGIAIDAKGKIYVADEWNDRVQKFSGLSLAAPTNLMANLMGVGNWIKLTWEDNSEDETNYFIRRKKGVSGLYEDIDKKGANYTSYIDTKVKEEDIYYYSVWAFNSYAKEKSEYSNEASIVMTSYVIPKAPSNLTGTYINNGCIATIISWIDNSEAEKGFRIELKIGDSGTYSEIGIVGVNVKSFTDVCRNADINYYYRIRAYSDMGNSNYSNEVAVRFPIN